jgi:hypothetical protein
MHKSPKDKSNQRRKLATVWGCAAFLLRAEGGEVWFSDVTVQELAPPQQRDGA